MKKLIVLGCLSLALVACEKKIPVFGDKSVLPTLELYSITDTIGTDYSSLLSSYTVKDTVLQTVPKAKLITFPLYKFGKRENLVTIHVRSNSRWGVNPPFSETNRAKWFMNTKSKMVGDGKVDHSIPKLTTTNSRPIIQVYYATADSSIIYKLIIRQLGKRDDPD